MAFMYKETYESPKNFLESEVGLIQKTMMGEQKNATTVDGKKIIKGGSLFPTNATGAKGIVFEDVDMTYDEKKPISVIVAGRVYENRLPASPDETAKGELEKQGIVFLTAEDPDFTGGEA